MQQASTPPCPILTPIRLEDVFGDCTTFQHNIRECVSGNNFPGWNRVGNMKNEDVHAILKLIDEQQAEDQEKLNSLYDAWRSFHQSQMRVKSRENLGLESRFSEQEKLKLKDQVEEPLLYQINIQKNRIESLEAELKKLRLGVQEAVAQQRKAASALETLVAEFGEETAVLETTEEETPVDAN